MIKQQSGETQPNETLEVIKRRRSNRSFIPNKQISDADLQAILDAGLSAPFGSTHERHFSVVQSKRLLGDLNHAAKWTARLNPEPHLSELGRDEKFNCLYDAPTLIVVSAKEDAVSPIADCAAATMNMLLAAESLGLGSCWVYFVVQAFSTQQGQKLREKLEIPEGYKPYTSVVLGYKTDPKVRTASRSKSVISYA